jgi:arylsulfatase A-like enzyme
MFLGRKPPTRLGPAAKEFEAIDVLPRLTEKAVEYIGSRAKDAKQGKPFFLYLPFASPHTPIAPTKEWQGKSGLNYYADFVLQNDACLGQILRTLDDLGLSEDTLLIVTSDNGCSPLVDFPELDRLGHRPSYHFRGAKADIYEGGHRVPFIARWPGHAKSGTKCDQTICHVDLLATCAELVGTKLPGDAGEDSFSILPALAGQVDQPLRDATVHHSVNGTFAIRQGKWKLVFAPHSGGWSDPKPSAKNLAELAPVQLYDFASDISEQKNVADDNPAIVDRLFALMRKYIDQGRSTPGMSQRNAVAVDLWKNGSAKPPLPR